jgi:hypothetical protein
MPTNVTKLPPGFQSAAGIALTSGVMAAGLGVGSEIFQFRWTDPNKLCAVKRVALWAGSIAAFAAGIVDFEMFIARNWTVDGSGGTAAAFTNNSGKLKSSFTDLVLGSARVASTAALTAGTKTLDAQAMSSLGGSVTATAGSVVMPVLEFISELAEFPLVLAQNEGFVIKATVPATGTWSFGVAVRHLEVAPGGV